MDEGAAAASSREGATDGGVVTNVSGIDSSHWEQQQFGEPLIRILDGDPSNYWDSSSRVQP